MAAMKERKGCNYGQRHSVIPDKNDLSVWLHNLDSKDCMNE
jgi:hypothetical protein